MGQSGYSEITHFAMILKRQTYLKLVGTWRGLNDAGLLCQAVATDRYCTSLWIFTVLRVDSYRSRILGGGEVVYHGFLCFGCRAKLSTVPDCRGT